MIAKDLFIKTTPGFAEQLDCFLKNQQDVFINPLNVFPVVEKPQQIGRLTPDTCVCIVSCGGTQ